MGVKSAIISNDLSKSDRKLSFKFNTKMDYTLEGDEYFIGNINEPIGVVSGTSLDELKAQIGVNFKLQKSFTENVTVEITDDNGDVIHKKDYVIDYYVKRLNPDFGGDDYDDNIGTIDGSLR